MTAVISTNALTKRFGSVLAVDRLDLEVARGEVFGLLGPNGAGKTTTIRLLLDIVRPSAGTIEVLGSTPRDDAVRARISFLPAELHLDRRYLVHEALGFLGSLRGGFLESDLLALMERFDLDPSRRIGELSTGNRRKVGVVQAFAARSELLILDEPTSGLDPLLQHELLTLIGERSAAGTTVLLSSHVLPEVERVADRIAVLREGRLALIGTVDDLRSRARQTIVLHLASPADPAWFDAVPNVLDVTATSQVISITFEGSADPVLKRAAQLSVERIVTSDFDLEAAFIGLYR